MVRFLIVAMFLLLNAPPVSAYQPLKDDTNGGNPKLAKKTYKVYIGKEPDGSGYRQEAIDALTQWKDALAAKGVTLDIQAGDPPQDPVDLKKYNEEVDKYNKDPNPDPSKYPEIAKYNAKKDTVSVYFKSSEEIQKMGSGSERGLTNNSWTFDGNGHADTIEESDVFIPTDPPGQDADIKKRMIHNITLHEGGHVAGADHYTKKQVDDGGKVMQSDATLFTEKLNLGPQDLKGLTSIYGGKPQIDIKPGVQEKDSSLLPLPFKNFVPEGVDKVWQYDYDLAWLGGGETDYFQVQTHGAGIFAAWGSNGLEDWLVKKPGPGENYLDFYADGVYLDQDLTSGTLSFLTDQRPGQGWLITQGGAIVGIAPVPEPLSVWLLLGGVLGAALARKFA